MSERRYARIIPNFMMSPPPNTPMPVDQQEQLASMAVASGSNETERAILDFFSNTPVAVLDAQLNASRT